MNLDEVIGALIAMRAQNPGNLIVMFELPNKEQYPVETVSRMDWAIVLKERP